jgi:hypothetical protein
LRGLIALLVAAVAAAGNAGGANPAPTHLAPEVKGASGRPASSTRVPPGQLDCDLPSALRDARGHILFESDLDKRGRVKDLRLLFSTIARDAPRPTLDDLLSACVRDRTHAPLEKANGKPVAGTKYFSFHFFTEPRPLPEDHAGKEPPELMVPTSWIDEIGSEQWRFAEALLSRAPDEYYAWRGLKVVHGDGWSLHTNEEERMIESVQEGMARARQAFDALFPAAGSGSGAPPVTILLFDDWIDRFRVERLNPFEDPGEEMTASYHPYFKRIYASAGIVPESILVGIIAHEAAHHWVAHRIYGGGREPPLWLNEGVASLIGAMRLTEKHASDTADFKTGNKGAYQRQAQTFLSELRLAIKQESLPRVADLVEGYLDEVLYRRGGQHGLLYHALSWALVHYLVNGEGGAHRQTFREWVMASASREDAPALEQALGRTLGEIEAALLTYLDGL